LSCCQHAQVDLVVVLAELDQQDRLRRLAHELVERRLEDRNLARELDHRAVDQFHRDRLEAHDVLRRIHRLEEAAEVAGADRAAAEQRRKLQLDARRKRQRPFPADEDVREVDVVLAGHQRVEIVAADAALHFREPLGDLTGFARADGEQILSRAAAAARAHP
jgi:hypothetical protein